MDKIVFHNHQYIKPQKRPALNSGLANKLTLKYFAFNQKWYQ